MDNPLKNEIEKVLFKFGFTPNGDETGMDFATYGYQHNNEKIYVKWKKVT